MPPLREQVPGVIAVGMIFATVLSVLWFGNGLH